MKKLNDLKNYKITDGASFSGIFLEISFDRLLELLGKPTVLGSADDKVQLEWDYTEKSGKNYKTLTIYDWKEDIPFHAITMWHVGAKNLDKNEIVVFLKKLGFDLNEEVKDESQL